MARHNRDHVYHCKSCKREILLVDHILHKGLCIYCYMENERQTHMPKM